MSGALWITGGRASERTQSTKANKLLIIPRLSFIEKKVYDIDWKRDKLLYTARVKNRAKQAHELLFGGFLLLLFCFFCRPFFLVLGEPWAGCWSDDASLALALARRNIRRRMRPTTRKAERQPTIVGTSACWIFVLILKIIWIMREYI